MTDILLSPQAAGVVQLLGGLGFLLLFLPYACSALRLRAGPGGAGYRTNALAAVLLMPLAAQEIALPAALLPGAWLGLSLLALALRRPTPASRLKRAAIPHAALSHRPPAGHDPETAAPPPPHPRAA